MVVGYSNNRKVIQVEIILSRLTLVGGKWLTSKALQEVSFPLGSCLFSQKLPFTWWVHSIFAV